MLPVGAIHTKQIECISAVARHRSTEDSVCSDHTGRVCMFVVGLECTRVCTPVSTQFIVSLNIVKLELECQVPVGIVLQQLLNASVHVISTGMAVVTTTIHLEAAMAAVAAQSHTCRSAAQKAVPTTIVLPNTGRGCVRVLVHWCSTWVYLASTLSKVIGEPVI